MPPVNIPGGLNANVHFTAIQNFLDNFLIQLGPHGVQRVTSRLNRSDVINVQPCWAGVVESQAVVNTRQAKGDPPAFWNPSRKLADAWKNRHGKSNSSRPFEDAITQATGAVISRDWNATVKPEGPAYGPADGHGPNINCKWQRFIAIRIPIAQLPATSKTPPPGPGDQFRHVGTLTVGFTANPTPSTIAAVDQIMRAWAQSGFGTPGTYTKYLIDNFNLGGPYFV